MKQFIAYLKLRPCLVAGTTLIVITFFVEKFLIWTEQQAIEAHDMQTVELLHTNSYVTEKFISKYLIEFNQEEERCQRMKSFLQPAITAIKRKN